MTKCSGFAFSTLLHLFFTSNSVAFVHRGRKNILPQGAGYASYATVLIAEKKTH